MIAAWHETVRERWRLLTFLREAGAGCTSVLGVCHALSSVVPALTALCTGWLVHEVASSVRDHAGITPLIAPLALLVVLFIGIDVAESTVEIVGLSAGRRIDQRVRQRVRRMASTPRGIEHLEQPSFHDDVLLVSDLGGGQRRSIGTAAVGQVLLMSRMFSAFISAVVVARFSLALAGALLVICLIVRARIRRQWLHLATVFGQQARQERRTEYWSEVLLNPGAAKEIRQFGAQDWLVGRRADTAMARLANIWAGRGSVLRRQGMAITAAFACGLAVLLLPGTAAAQGALRPDHLVTYMVAGWAILAISAMGREPFDIEYGLVAVKAFDRLITAHGPDLVTGMAVSTEGTPRIRFESVEFTYPGAQSPTLHGLDLEIQPGEVLAIVGHNGAGKTTLTKLLAGLYRPTKGRIIIDGTDLNDLNIDQWHARMCVVFQDFIHYPVTLRENVMLSAPEVGEAAIESAMAAAGADGLTGSLPAGAETPLWRGTTGGVELSGGQWQKIAIARALYAVEHGRRVLVLDEPTAHLDVSAEVAFFDQVVDAAAGASIVLISHRLSTIRRADRILLLSAGRVAESGSHEDLMALDGEYARLYRLQASRFAVEDVSA